MLALVAICLGCKRRTADHESGPTQTTSGENVRPKRAENPKDVKNDNAKDAVVHKLGDVLDTYSVNDASGDLNFKDKFVRGHVWALRVTKLNSGRYTLDVEINATFFFDPDQQENLAKLNLTKLVEVEGICRGKVLGNVTLERCRIVSNDRPRP